MPSPKGSNQPMTMDQFRKVLGSAEGRKIIGTAGGSGSSNSPSAILKKLTMKIGPMASASETSLVTPKEEKALMLQLIRDLKKNPDLFVKGKTKEKKTMKAAKGGMPDYSKKKAHQMNMGGMMEEKKINPSTGMAMKKGGMIDYRKGGMFYGGGMAKARSRGK